MITKTGTTLSKTARFSDVDYENTGIPIESKAKPRSGIDIRNVGMPIEPKAPTGIPIENVGIPIESKVPRKMTFTRNPAPIDMDSVGMLVDDLKPRPKFDDIPWWPHNYKNIGRWGEKAESGIGDGVKKILRSVL